MSDSTETVATDGELAAMIVWDEYNDENNDPRQYENLGVMAARGHREYLLGDQTDETQEVHDALVRTRKPNVVARWLKVYRGATVVLPLGLIDHSGISIYVGSGAHWCDPGGWDSGLIGLIYDTPETRENTGAPLESIERQLRAEVAEYDRYLTGDVWGIRVTRETVDGDTETLDECWGLLGREYAEQEARATLEHYAKTLPRQLTLV